MTPRIVPATQIAQVRVWPNNHEVIYSKLLTAFTLDGTGSTRIGITDHEFDQNARYEAFLSAKRQELEMVKCRTCQTHVLIGLWFCLSCKNECVYTYKRAPGQSGRGAGSASAAPAVAQGALGGGASSASAAAGAPAAALPRVAPAVGAAAPERGVPYARTMRRSLNAGEMAADPERMRQMRQQRTSAADLGRGEARQEMFFPARRDGRRAGMTDPEWTTLLRNLRHYGNYHQKKHEVHREGRQLEDKDLSSGARPFAYRGYKDAARTIRLLPTWSRRLIKHLYWEYFHNVRNADTSTVEYQTAKQSMLALYRQGRARREEDPRYRGPPSEWTESDEPPPGDYVDVDSDTGAEVAQNIAAAPPASTASGSASLPAQTGAGSGGAGSASAATKPEPKRRRQ